MTPTPNPQAKTVNEILADYAVAVTGAKSLGDEVETSILAKQQLLAEVLDMIGEDENWNADMPFNKKYTILAERQFKNNLRKAAKERFK